MRDTAADRVSDSPFHEGEQRIQEALGVRAEMEEWGRQVVRPFLPEQHANFYGQLPFVVAAARDARGRPWATVLAGEPGFIAAPTPDSLSIAAHPSSGDALSAQLTPGSDVGLLGIELHTRRRNRVNGRVRATSSGEVLLDVDQAFGNCPQHIRNRDWGAVDPRTLPGDVRRTASLTPKQCRAIEDADTFFIASGHPGAGESAASGMDASHRGGPRGFVLVESDNELVFPDYSGNNHFNTLGNLVLDPRAGLVFVDFETGGLLQLTGRANVDWAKPDPIRFPGALRLVRFEIEAVVEQDRVLPIRWTRPKASNLELTIVDTNIESADVLSLLLESTSDASPPTWKPGQHLPIELVAPDGRLIERTYSLSNAPENGKLRISVKREIEGRASNLIHDSLTRGSTLRAHAPGGDFFLEADALPVDRPLLLIGAGIGITPLASMFHSLLRDRPDQQVTLVHGVRDGKHHPLGQELRDTAAALGDANVHVRYSRPTPEDHASAAYDSTGRINGSLLDELVDVRDAEIFLCGPANFMAGLRSELLERGALDDRIHFETF